MTTLNWIDPGAPPDCFPPVSSALAEPEGLLASGGDLSVPRLVAAYRRGIFPWYDAGQPVLWWAPDPRAFIPAENLHVSKTLKRSLRRVPYELSFDQDFRSVMTECAAPRREQPETWILPEMIDAYCELQAAGYAHSVEVRIDGQLAGGIYGVAIGRTFCAESMFSRVSDASKIALTALMWQLQDWGFPGIDCQLQSSHLDSMGCVMLPRDEFTQMLDHYQRRPGPPAWEFDGQLMQRRLRPAGNS